MSKITEKEFEEGWSKVELIIWGWRKDTNETWEKNPTASSPFYGMKTVKHAVRALCERHKVDTIDGFLTFDNAIKNGLEALNNPGDDHAVIPVVSEQPTNPLEREE